jgi:hypothetical protein
MNDKIIPGKIEKQTDELLQPFACFIARTLFGVKEKFVTPMEYDHDKPWPTEPKQTHTSICKPRGRYLRPFEFALRENPHA